MLTSYHAKSRHLVPFKQNSPEYHNNSTMTGILDGCNGQRRTWTQWKNCNRVYHTA